MRIPIPVVVHAVLDNAVLDNVKEGLLVLPFAVSVVKVPAAAAVPPIAGGLLKSNVPPRLKFPLLVTVPLSVIPLTVPVPPTLLTLAAV